MLPYLGAGEPRGFWQYNKTLLLRALTTGIWAAVIFAALALALGALDVLFGLKMASERYIQLWILVTLGFSVWFFAAGIPPSLQSLNNETDYGCRCGGDLRRSAQHCAFVARKSDGAT